MDLPWPKLDVVTFSWQKVLGGEGAHGMLILSPRAAARLESLRARLADAETVPPDQGQEAGRRHLRRRDDQHAFDAGARGLPRCAEMGGSERRAQGPDRARRLQSRRARAMGREARLGRFPRADPKTRSNTSVCLKIVDPWFTALAKDAQAAAASKIASMLEKEGVALDIGGYRSAPPGLRIWCGSTVERADIEKLTPWLDWAFAQVKQS